MSKKNCVIAVSGLPASTDDEGLVRLFSGFGSIASCNVCEDDAGTQRRGYVQFTTREAAESALASMRGCSFRGTSLRITLAGLAEADFIPNDMEVKPAREYLYGRTSGTVVEWKGPYGWVEADTAIKHPLAGKHDGRVYVNVTDTENGTPFDTGDRVTFKPYADHDGIGAAEVRLESTNENMSLLAPRPYKDAHFVASAYIELSVDGWPASLEDTFKRSFAKFGEVVASKLSRPRQAGLRATGTVTFRRYESAEQACDALDGKLFGGTPLRVTFANSDEDRRPLRQSAGGEAGRSAAQPVAKDAIGVSQGRPSQASGGLERRVPAKDADRRHTGVVTNWKGSYGWVTPDKFIPMESNMKHKGFVYIAAKDLEVESELRTGDRVSFKVYYDNQGTGGTQVRRASPARRAASSALPAPARPAKWWHALAGECCPISLNPLEEMECEPFGLLGTLQDADAGEYRGLWGPAAIAAFEASKVVHWFDGRYLACTIVSTATFVDPISMRALTRSECASLDEYLAAKGFPKVQVAAAFDVTEAGGARPTNAHGEHDLNADAQALAGSLTFLSGEALCLMKLLDEDPAAFPVLPQAGVVPQRSEPRPAARAGGGYPAGVQEQQQQQQPPQKQSPSPSQSQPATAQKSRRWGRKG